MKRLALILFVGLTACQSGETQDDDLSGGDPTERTDCQAMGGTYGRFGLAQSYLCRLPTEDAGKACTSTDQCSGFCLADSGTCSPVSPYFGCHAILESDGERVTICID